MTFVLLKRSFRQVTLSLGAVLMCVGSASAAPLPMPPVEVKDPYYGEVLFHALQQDKVIALSHLLAAIKSKRLPSNKNDVWPVAADLFIDYGLLEDARQAIDLIQGKQMLELQSQLRLKLAHAYYQRNDGKGVEESIERLPKSLPDDLEEQRDVLRALLLMRNGQLRRAAELLAGVKGRTEQGNYGRYNYAIALLKTGALEEGVDELNKLGRQNFASEEMRSLKDKANLALGYLLLQAKSPMEAKPYLERIRLNGLHSGRALLGIGWANLMLSMHEQALVPWMELLKRNPSEGAVLEAYMAVPYALSQAMASGQALKYYDTAITTYASELKRTEAALASVKKSVALQNFLDEKQTAVGSATSPEVRAAIQLMANSDFFLAVNNYRDLRRVQEAVQQRLREISLLASSASKKSNANDQPNPGLTLRQSVSSEVKQQFSDLSTRAEKLQRDNAVALKEHTAYIQREVAVKLEQEKARLSVYLAQARFSMAQLYDRVADRKEPAR